MNQKWVATYTRHHNMEAPSWYSNIEADNKDTALLLAYKEVINDLDIEVTLEELKPILTQDNLLLRLPEIDSIDVVNIVIWNDNDNQGLGIGATIEETNKHENIWLEVEPRTDKNLDIAVKGYLHKLSELPTETLKNFLHLLDNIN